MCTFGALGLSCEAPAAQKPLALHASLQKHNQNSTKDPQEREEKMKTVAGEGTRNFRHPPFGCPTLRGPHPSAFHFFRFGLQKSTSKNWPKSKLAELERNWPNSTALVRTRHQPPGKFVPTSVGKPSCPKPRRLHPFDRWWPKLSKRRRGIRARTPWDRRSACC